jgi:hypothetical protein
MARVIALATAPLRLDRVELTRAGTVLGCALALIMAGRFLPF